MTNNLPFDSPNLFSLSSQQIKQKIVIRQLITLESKKEIKEMNKKQKNDFTESNERVYIRGYQGR